MRYELAILKTICERHGCRRHARALFIIEGIPTGSYCESHGLERLARADAERPS